MTHDSDGSLAQADLDLALKARREAQFAYQEAGKKLTAAEAALEAAYEIYDAAHEAYHTGE